jgi:hypothetical protein
VDRVRIELPEVINPVREHIAIGLQNQEGRGGKRGIGGAYVACVEVFLNESTPGLTVFARTRVQTLGQRFVGGLHLDFTLDIGQQVVHMRDRFENGSILMFEFVPKCLEPFPIGEDFNMFADCCNNIDLFDRF